MIQEPIVENLVVLGLLQIDAEVYVFLAANRPQKAREIIEALKISKQQLYRSLRRLKGKGIVFTSCERPATFSALHIEGVIDLLVKTILKEAQHMEENKEKILSFWFSMMKENKNSL